MIFSIYTDLRPCLGDDLLGRWFLNVAFVTRHSKFWRLHLAHFDIARSHRDYVNKIAYIRCWRGHITLRLADLHGWHGFWLRARCTMSMIISLAYNILERRLQGHVLVNTLSPTFPTITAMYTNVVESINHAEDISMQSREYNDSWENICREKSVGRLRVLLQPFVLGESLPLRGQKSFNFRIQFFMLL